MSDLRRCMSVLVGAAVVALAVAGRADAPILHEYVEPNAAEDIEIGATTPDGRMPAAVRTPSGLISAPSFGSNVARQVAYGGSATPDSIDATYRIDRDTTQPDAVRYDDPFTPAVAPFKRLYAFDAVDSKLELGVADKRLKSVPVGGELGPNEDHFFGDLFVDVAASVPVRIPSVGPGTRVLALRVEPAMKVEVRRDGADNFFVIGEERRRVRLILELSAPRAVFGSDFPQVSYAELAAWVTPLPSGFGPVVEDVLSKLGLSRQVPPRQAVAALVAHFRGFAPSGELPSSEGGPELYRELVLGRKGVCRHRAYGFMLSALGLGIPARFVRNEAHAWVEVGDGRIWHRIDLGGAAGRFEIDAQNGAPPHAVPSDPYAWPEGAQSGLSAADAAQGSGSGAPSGNGSPSGSGQGTPGRGGLGSNVPSVVPSGRAPDFTAPSSAPVEDERPNSAVELSVSAGETRRGAALRVSGQVTSGGSGCAHARVDIALVGQRGEALIGSVPTDAAGRFDSPVTVPFDIDVGEYMLRASTPGAGDCGPSSIAE